MRDASPSHDAHQTPRWFPLAIIVLSGFGIALSGLSLYEHVAFRFNTDYEALCGFAGVTDCKAVSTSSYATWFGVPVASYGLLFYAFTLFYGVVGLRYARRLYAPVGLIMATAALIPSFALLYISYAKLHAFCLACIAMDVVNVALFLLSLAAARGSLATRFMDGVRGVLALPRALMGTGEFKGTPVPNISLIGAVWIVLCIAVILNLPARIGARFGSPQRDTQQAVLAEAVRRWERSPAVAPKVEADPAAPDYIRGPAGAKVTIVEFSDFQCPACQRAYPAIEEVLRRYDGKVQFVFKNYPLDGSCNQNFAEGEQGHVHACYAAHLARCAGEQGKFWEMIHHLFNLPQLQAEAPFDDTRAAMGRLSEKLGLNGEAITSCMESRRHMGKLGADVTEGDRLGLRGTPTVYINGRVAPAPGRVELLSAIVDRALEE